MLEGQAPMIVQFSFALADYPLEMQSVLKEAHWKRRLCSCLRKIKKYQVTFPRRLFMHCERENTLYYTFYF